MPRLLLPMIACLWLATGCNVSAPHQIVLKFWAMGSEGEIVTQLLPEFERRHPDIRVEVQQLPWSSAHEKLLTAFAGDATPDICQLGNTWIPELAALGALEALDTHLAASPVVDRRDYFDGIWDTNIIDGKLYGVPWYVDTRLFFYRRDILRQAGFAAPPRTWPELMKMLTAIKARGGANHFGILLPVNEFEPLVALALQQEEPLLRDSGRWGNFRSAGFRRTLSFYHEMFQRKLAPPLTNSEVANVWNEFGRGYYAFYLSGPWNIGEFKRRLPPGQQDNWMTAALPGPNGPGASIAGGASLAVFRASKHKQEAWQLLEYLSQPEIQQRFRELTGDLPPRRAAWNDPQLAQDKYARAFREQLELAKPTPKVPEWERIATEMKFVSERLVRGYLTLDQAVEELDARADRILEKRRWMLDRNSAK